MSGKRISRGGTTLLESDEPLEGEDGTDVWPDGWSVITPRVSIRSSLKKRGVQMVDESLPDEDEPSDESSQTEE